jgi:CBS domain-containing protein
MTPSPAWCAPQDSLEKVARQMAERGCGAIPVVDDPICHRPVGMITDRDIILRVVAQGRSTQECLVRDVMTAEPISLHVDASFHDCARAMMLHRVRRIMVVDDRGKLIGIVTDGDLARACKRDPVLEHDLAAIVEEVSMPLHPPLADLAGTAVVGEAIRSARPLGGS